MKRITLILIAFVSVIQIAQAQIDKNGNPDFSFKHDPSLFVGTWEASQGDNSYTLIISKYKFEVNQELGLYADILVGELIYKTNGEVVRHIKPDGHKAMFSIFGSNIRSTHLANFVLDDLDRRVRGEGEFSVDKNDLLKAQWKLKKYPENKIRAGLGSMNRDLNKKDFDIPMNLQWRKVE